MRLNIDRVRRLRRELLPGDFSHHDRPIHLEEEIDPALVRALDRLPPKQRAAVVLRAVADLEHAAIADRLGCSVGTARTHLSRGLGRLREVLAEEVKGDV